MRPPDSPKSPNRVAPSEPTRLSLATSILPLLETRFWLWLPLRAAIFLLERFAALVAARSRSR
jgi:hypothetical protein